jgi:hypothetical protein
LTITLGRSLNSCQLAFESMNHQLTPANRNQQPTPRSELWAVHPGPVHVSGQMPAPVTTSSLMSAQDSHTQRKRPFYPSEKPAAAPRAIQPRPPLSARQFGSESGSPGPMSPGWESTVGKGGEPPRKRGRPSKAESERRKAEAKARGEEYPPRRRSTITNVKNSPTLSGSANAASDRSFPSPLGMLHTPEMQKQELHSEGVGGTDAVQPDSTGRRHTDPSVAKDMDPVRGIIRSQASQDRRLPHPHEMQPRPGSFVAYTPPRERSFPAPRALEAPFGGGPRSFTEGGIIHSPVDHSSKPQTENPQHIPTSAGPIQAVRGQTNT